VLLLNHVLRPFSGWGLPGGFIEHNEAPETAICRELIEETGIELSDLTLFRVRVVGKHVEILFTARTKDVGSVLSCEIIELGWFDPNELPRGMSPAQKRIIAQVFSSDI
jgi:ADP-ribose pyrophosphatase YjhB (NUDIX family)